MSKKKNFFGEICLLCLFAVINLLIIFFYNEEIKHQVMAQKIERKNEKKLLDEKERVEAAKKKAEEEVRLAQEKADRLQKKIKEEEEKQKRDEEKRRREEERIEERKAKGIHKYKVIYCPNVTWYEADEAATESELGSVSYLAHITSEEEQKEVIKVLKKERSDYKTYWYFIGGSCEGDEYDNYRFVSGFWEDEILNDGIGYENWLKNEPSNDPIGDFDREQYMKLQYIEGLKKWKWMDVSSNHGNTNGEPYRPEKGAFIIEYEE